MYNLIRYLKDLKEHLELVLLKASKEDKEMLDAMIGALDHLYVAILIDDNRLMHQYLVSFSEATTAYLKKRP